MSGEEPAVLPNAAAVEAAAGAFADIGPAADSAMAGLTSAWSRLAAPGVYQSPESAPVLAAMDEPSTVAGTLGDDAAAAKTALETYATTLAGLEARRRQLVDDLADRDAALAAQAADPASAPDPSTSGQAALGLATRITQFNRDAEQADQDCADALVRLVRYSSKQVADFVDAANDVVGHPVLGLGVSIADQWDEVKDVFQGEAQRWGFFTTDGDHRGPFAATNEHGQVVRPVPPVDDARPPGARATGVGAGAGAAATGAADDLGRGHVAGPSAVSEAGRLGGRALGVAGAALTIGTSFTDQYRRDQAAHPEWDEGQRRQSAATTAAFQGGGSAAGAWAGAAVGAQWGATIGTMIFPGAGTIIGGLAGGIIGGVIGGGVGQKMGEGLQDLVGDLFG